MINGFEDFQKAGREGMSQGSRELRRCFEELADAGERDGRLSKHSFEEGAAHVEKLLGAKSIDVAFEAQTDFLRASYEKAVGQAARFGELYMDLVKEATKPFEGFVPAAKK